MDSKYVVYCADDGMEYIFLAETPLHAMEKMLYCENVKKLDEKAKITNTKLGNFEMTHNEKTYWCRVTPQNGNGRDLYIATGRFGEKRASFIRGEKRVERLLTPTEAEHARQLIEKDDPYAIDNFCYGIS